MKGGKVEKGSSSPLGATVEAGGVNFSVYSRDATHMELLLFDNVNAGTPTRVIQLAPEHHRSYHYWHVFVPGLLPGQVYAYRAFGPNAPERGLRFDAHKVLLDPYGLSVGIPERYSRHAACAPGDNTPFAMKNVVLDPRAYDWEGDEPLRTPRTDTVIYELHVRGFTQHESSKVAPTKRGTYAGLIEKIPYLVDLGITAVELLPVFQFDPTDAPAGLTNYWGYQPISFFAPHAGYGSTQDPLGVVNEFRDMVKALHRAGIEVILDVVFNHTTEGGTGGPTLSYRGLANNTYYLLDSDRSRYADYTGCGNTLNANHSVVRRLIQDSLRYWVREMHVDGFRFDLASVLSRDLDGQPRPNPPVVWDIESDPLLSGSKLIAEAWDAAGLYQVGQFVGDSWGEWNGHFRDDVRRFLKGDKRMVSRVATRMLGSPDVFGQHDREAERSVHFVTCHDGFTLNDLVSYDQKHNDDNREDNRDGMNENFSWNCGAEGPTSDEAVEELRNRQVKNFMALQMLAVGMPMLLMGDEVRRTQRGNNNAYCQDNDISWFDWTLVEKHADIHRFASLLSHMRSRRDATFGQRALTLGQLLETSSVTWHGIELGRPDWGDNSHALAFEILGIRRRYRLFGILNAFWKPLRFRLPPVPAHRPWRRTIDTALPSPEDICPLVEAPAVEQDHYDAKPRSVVLLGQLLHHDSVHPPSSAGRHLI